MNLNSVLLWIRSRSAATRNDLDKVEIQIMAVQNEIHQFTVDVTAILVDLNTALEKIASTPPGVGLGYDDRIALATFKNSLVNVAAKASTLANPAPVPTAAAEPTATP